MKELQEESNDMSTIDLAVERRGLEGTGQLVKSRAEDFRASLTRRTVGKLVSESGVPRASPAR